MKDEYKIYYGKMKEEVITLRHKLRESEESMHEIRREKDILANNCRHVEQQLAHDRQTYQQMMQGALPVAREDENEDDWN